MEKYKGLKAITNKGLGYHMALAMYCNKPCRICGKLIESKDLEELVFAGYSKDCKSRTAHGYCWINKGKNKEQWVFPEDDKDEEDE